MIKTRFNWVWACIFVLVATLGCNNKGNSAASNGNGAAEGERKGSNATETIAFERVTTFSASVIGFGPEMTKNLEVSLELGALTSNDNGKLSCKIVREHEKLPKAEKWKVPMRLYSTHSAEQTLKGAFRDALTFSEEDLTNLTMKVDFFYKGRIWPALWRLNVKPVNGKCTPFAEVCESFINRGAKHECDAPTNWKPIHDVKAIVTPMGDLTELMLQFYDVEKPMETRTSTAPVQGRLQ